MQEFIDIVNQPETKKSIYKEIEEAERNILDVIDHDNAPDICGYIEEAILNALFQSLKNMGAIDKDIQTHAVFALKEVNREIEDNPYDIHDWESVKSREILRTRQEVLHNIIKKKTNKSGDLTPQEKSALCGTIGVQDIEAHMRYNLYTEYLDCAIRKAINDLRATIYVTGGKFDQQREKLIKSLYDNYNISRKLESWPEEQVWNHINEKWGLIENDDECSD